MNKTNINFNFACRFIGLIIGLLIMSFGIGLFLKSDLRANPLTTFTCSRIGIATILSILFTATITAQTMKVIKKKEKNNVE